MLNPNQKLQEALETFYETKIAEFKQQYHFNQKVEFCIVPDTWNKSIKLLYDCNIDKWELSSVDPFKPWVAHNGFFEKYADIKKHLDAVQKKEDSLFRFAEKQNNIKEQQSFSISD